jgi:hypothetical protein
MPKMKMTDEHFQALQRACVPILLENQGMWKGYQKLGRSRKRFRWDILWASKFNVNPLYDYLEDSNIDTALIAICDSYML